MSAASAQFITFEGIEGVGKSTQVALLAGFLRAQGLEVVCTREPGGTAFGERLRELVLQSKSASPLAELLLMFAARAVHVEEVIRPALALSRWVVCDRFTDASFAYQGGGRGLSPGLIESLARHTQGSIEPTMTVLLDAPLELGRARAAARDKARTATDRFESETPEFFARVRSAYLQRAAQHSERFVVIDASGSSDEVHAAIVAALRVHTGKMLVA